MYTIKNTTGGCGAKGASGAGIAPPGNPGDVLYLVSSGVAGAASNVLYTGDGNLYAANSITTTNAFVTNVFAARYYGDGGLLSNITSFVQPLANLVVSNSVTTTNIFATSANIATMNVGYLTVNSAVVYGTSTLNVYGTSNLTNVTVTDTFNVNGSMTANVANATFFFDTFTIPYINTYDLTVSGTLSASGVYGTSQGVLYTYPSVTALPAAFSSGTAGPSVNAYHIDLSGFTAEYAQPVIMFSASTGLLKFTTAGLYQITCVFVADQPVSKVAVGKTATYTTWASLQASGTTPTSGYDYVYNYPIGSSPSEVVTLPINVTDTSKYYYIDLFLSTATGTPTSLYPTRSGTAVGAAYGTYVQVSPFGNFLLGFSSATTYYGNVVASNVVVTPATGVTGISVTGNVYASNAVTTTNVFATTANVGTINVWRVSNLSTLELTNNLYASNSVTTTNIFAASANIATMNVGYLTVNSAVVYGTSTLNVYGVSNLSTTTVNGSMNVTGPLATLANLYVPGNANIEYLSVSNLSVTGNLIVTATNVQTTNAFTINNAGTATALKVTQNEPSIHTHNVAEFWDSTTLAMVIDPEGNVAIHTVSSPGYALTVTDPANFETLYIRGKTGATTLNVTGNLYASNAVTTTNVFTTNVTATTVTGTSVIGTHYGSLAGSNTIAGSTQTLGGTAGATTMNVTGNLYASNAVTTTNLFTTNVFATTANVGTVNVWQVSNLSTLVLTNNLYASNAVTATSHYGNVVASNVVVTPVTGVTGINVTGNLYASNAVTTTNLFTTNVTATGVQTISGLTGRTSLNVTGNLYASNAVTTTNIFSTNVYVSSNVGINQTTPQTLLHVTATASNSAIMIDNSAVTMSVRPIATNPGSANCHIWADGNAVGTADAGFLRIAAGGGSSTGQKSYIDVSGYSPVTDLNQNIVFGTLGAERMRVDNSGRLGIGTASPQYPLDVAGQPRFSIQPVIQATQLGIASSAAASWYRLASLQATARAKFRIYTNGANLQEQVVVTTSWSAAYSGYPTVRIEDQSSATFAGTQPLYNGQIRTLVYVSSNGIWYLEVYLSSVATAYTLYVQLIEGDASGASITLTSPIVAGSIPTNYIAQPTVPVNAFSVTPWNTTSNASLLVTNTGNVGIGTTSPGYLLDGEVNANIDGGAQIRNASTGTAAVAAWRVGNANGSNRGGISILGSGYTTSGIYRQDGVYTFSAGTGGFTLSAQGASNVYFCTNSTERMRLDSTGYLTFGTPVVNKIITLFDATGTAPVSATDFYGFGINGGTLRYQTDGSSSVHKFYGGSTLYATIGTQVQVPGKYYAAGYLNGATTAGNVINLTTLQTQGGMTVTTSNKLVAPVAGLYHFGFQTIMQTSTGRNDVYIWLNGNNLVNTLSEDNGAGYHQRTASMCYYLNANDYIQFYCATGTVYGVSASDDNNWRKWYFYHVG